MNRSRNPGCWMGSEGGQCREKAHLELRRLGTPEGAQWLLPPLPTKLITCRVCSMALGKFFSVQMGMDFSGGSWLEL